MRSIDRLRAIVVAGLVVAYLPFFQRLIAAWAEDPYAGHGVFVPGFSLLALWADRDALRRSPREPTRWGLVLLGSGLGLLVLGTGVSILALQGLSLPLVVSGLVALWFGAAPLRRAAFPIGLLWLMVPLPRPIVAAITSDIQRFVAAAAAFLLDLLGVPVYHVGLLLHLPTLTIEVAEVCNGLRFLAALLVLTMTFAHITQPTLPRKLVLVGVALPTAVLANALRVTGIAIAVYYIGPHAARGFIHDYIGKGTWALTILALCAFGYLLQRTATPRQ